MKKNNENLSFASVAIKSISLALNNNGPLETDDSFDWSSFLKFCSNHKILNIVYYGLKRTDIIIPEKIRKIFEDNILHSMLKDAQRDVEINNLSEQFEINNIKHMVLKGFIIKELYPESFLRSMSDVDILIGDNIDFAAEILMKNGFELKSKEFLHYSFSKKNSFAIELHKSLIDESLKKYYNYFQSGFERAKLCDNSKFKYELSPEDFYIFLIAHLAKHYSICGTGIRSICDVFIYNKSLNNLNRAYIENELDKIGLKNFENKIRKLSYDWFENGLNDDFDAVGEYIISNGVYGNIDNHELNKFFLDNKAKGKFGYILRTVLPGKEYMCARYSILKNYPCLIPIFWIFRIISTLLNKKQSIRYRLKGVSFSNKKDYDRFNDVGIK